MVSVFSVLATVDLVRVYSRKGRASAVSPDRKHLLSAIVYQVTHQILGRQD